MNRFLVWGTATALLWTSHSFVYAGHRASFEVGDRAYLSLSDRENCVSFQIESLLQDRTALLDKPFSRKRYPLGYLAKERPIEESDPLELGTEVYLPWSELVGDLVEPYFIQSYLTDDSALLYRGWISSWFGKGLHRVRKSSLVVRRDARSSDLVQPGEMVYETENGKYLRVAGFLSDETALLSEAQSSRIIYRTSIEYLSRSSPFREKLATDPLEIGTRLYRQYRPIHSIGSVDFLVLTQYRVDGSLQLNVTWNDNGPTSHYEALPVSDLATGKLVLERHRLVTDPYKIGAQVYLAGSSKPSEVLQYLADDTVILLRPGPRAATIRITVNELRALARAF